MKRIMKYSMALSALAIAGGFGACTNIDVEAPSIPNLPTVTNLNSAVNNRVVTLNWQLPTSSMEVEGVTVKINNNAEQAVYLSGPTTSYSIKGQPMDVEYMYTVKVNYKGGYVSEGQSVLATVPYEELSNVSNLEVTNIEGRTVTLSWTLPNAVGITGVLVGVDGNDVSSFSYYPGEVTTVTLAKQPNGQSIRYRVLVQYDNAYTSAGETCPADIPYVETKAGFLLLAESDLDLEDDDEKAAATWFYDNYVSVDKGDFIKIADLPDLDAEEYGVLWIMVDRIGVERGWQNLPDGLANATTINALKDYSANNGNIYLSNMATQLTVPLGFVPENMPINTFSSGEGGTGGDVWTINPHLGWDFQGTDNYYDRAEHAIYAGITMEDPNGYGYASVPLIGPGQREDHNSLWDINPYWHEAGDPAPNCVKWFENVTNSTVLATWGHVRDHCVAGMVEFKSNDVHGRCLANGFAAYEWNQNSGPNPYQGNIEKLTENIINYLK